MINLPIPRLDKNPEIRNCLLKYSRLKEGEIWDDPLGKHRMGCLYDYLFQPSFTQSVNEKSYFFAVGILKQLLPSLQRPSKTLDEKYSGQYDFFLPPHIRIEVKASRAVDFELDEPLYIKALASDSQRPFDMNFQQIKPACCDVFVWLAAWRDAMRYWVIPSHDVENSPYYSKGQHRGNVGEGQLHLNRENIAKFDKYLCKSTGLEKAIKEAFKKEKKFRRGA